MVLAIKSSNNSLTESISREDVSETSERSANQLKSDDREVRKNQNLGSGISDLSII